MIDRCRTPPCRTRRIRNIIGNDAKERPINDAGWSDGFYGFTDANADTFFAKGVPDTGQGLPKWKSLLPVLKIVVKLRKMPKMISPDTPPMKALLQDHARADWRDVVAAADVPILMVAGRDSQFWPCTHAADSIVDNPLGHSVVLDHCGHAANMDRPKEFNAVLLEFLGSLS